MKRSLLVLTTFFAMLLAMGLAAQSPPAKPAAAAAPKAAKATAPSGVDTVIELVKAGMSEALVIRTLKGEGKTYKLSTADLLKLQKAGVSENIIEAMSNQDPAGDRLQRRLLPRRQLAPKAAPQLLKRPDRPPPTLLTLQTFLPTRSGGWRSGRSTTRPSRPG
jgi:hypothetical protein